MESSLAESILSVCNVLNKHAVEYVIIGGAAVAFHGFYRHSINTTGVVAEKPDLDFWYNPTYANYFRLLNALEELEQDVTKFKKEKAPKPKSSFVR